MNTNSFVTQTACRLPSYSLCIYIRYFFVDTYRQIHLPIEINTFKLLCLGVPLICCAFIPLKVKMLSSASGFYHLLGFASVPESKEA